MVRDLNRGFVGIFAVGKDLLGFLCLFVAELLIGFWQIMAGK
jgi:hypothetical protein